MSPKSRADHIILRLGNQKFKLVSAPFLKDPENANLFYAAVSRLLRLWSHFELNLDVALGIIARMPEWQPRREAIPESVPASMKKKADMWRRALKKIERLAPERENALLLMSDAMDTAEDRGTIVHPRWEGFISSDL